MQRMLLVFAHPGDESFVAGGTIAKYAKKGWEIGLICATRGEAGESETSAGVKGEALGIIRERELREAAKILRIGTVTILGYKDGALSQQHFGELEDKIFRKMVEFQPAIVITFDTKGLTNHPDHIKISYAATFAFQKYALTKPESRLYWVCLPETIVNHLCQQKIIPAESFGKPLLGTPDKKITTVIDVTRVKKDKVRAVLAHESQIAGFQAKINEGMLSSVLRREYFILHYHGTSEVYLGKDERISASLCY